ncbi:MAG: DUF5011 domain-containing protein, partial [Candidatus Staskawiczbacteria bacterium]|nr:DUF5011 domain-containing protein [Candidatus Staskawiczbacteria bacterium]
TIDMSGFGTTVGEYDFYISYCGGHDCASAPYGDVIGNYYRTYFDGTTWSAIAVDNSKTRLSSDAKVTALNYYLVSTLSANYTAGVYSSGTGTIKNVRLGTSKTDFKSALTPASGATLEDSGLTNPILTGNTLVVTAQDGVTKATYTITADTVAWSQGTINSYTSAGKFYLDTSFFTDNQSIGCNLYLYQSLYPLQTNEQEEGSFPCGGNNGTRPVYTLDMASFTAVGDYTIWMSDQSINSGRYYEIHFDGTVWSSLSSVAADTTPPTGTITINSGALYTNTRNVTLTLSATDDSSGVAQMQFNNGTGAYSSLEAYSTTKSWELSASGDGVKTVRVKFKDNAGNETVTGIPATITLDTTAPVIALNGNATINLAVGDSYSELGATATDNIDSTGAVAIAGDTVSTLAPATFHITYDA